MDKPVYVVSEWLPKKGCEKKFLDICKAFAKECLEKEPDCVSYRVTQQIPHPGSLGKTKFTIILMETFKSIEAFDVHCNSEHLDRVFETYINEGPGCLVEDWRCRLFSEA